ncbi:NAD(P)-dependent oxidoreductase [Saccharopolyspora mangrovi]|uniref:NAD(P)H-binding protein n=1 Tax=Saccharopolyspora mangrovi TaxID=3082379 RepID=A0ABU6AJJ0_9PSEU|nr:NAD(P)H-binding protein [Saccharopolyspora sp. S2-29]MEB3371723.1 NAD(P)H-binding protein [Saccharopolyspora sp. S2-29]
MDDLPLAVNLPEHDRDVPGKEAITTGNVLETMSVTKVAEEHDVVISAVGGGNGAAHQATIKPSAIALVEAMRALGDKAPRLISVGGAGSLKTTQGQQVWDAPDLPENLLQIMHAHGDALDYYRTVTDVDWTNISPAAHIAPGKRTGAYRSALDSLVTDESGNSSISTEDFAVAVIDEVERPQHNQRLFTVAH